MKIHIDSWRTWRESLAVIYTLRREHISKLVVLLEIKGKYVQLEGSQRNILICQDVSHECMQFSQTSAEMTGGL
jgi:hypothetical protein